MDNSIILSRCYFKSSVLFSVTHLMLLSGLKILILKYIFQRCSHYPEDLFCLSFVFQMTQWRHTLTFLSDWAYFLANVYHMFAFILRRHFKTSGLRSNLFWLQQTVHATAILILFNLSEINFYNLNKTVMYFDQQTGALHTVC